jgi:pre-mRNA-splicing factor SYF1
MRDPGSTKPWLAYIDFKLQHGSIHEQAFVLERACLQLPRSYKLWKMVGLPWRRAQGTAR